MKLVPVILCGGSGVRLWPLSRAAHPKQLLPLTGEYSLIQQTARRVAALEASPPLVICNQAHRFMVASQLEAIGAKPVIVAEPEGRNTAPAAAIAALMHEHDDDTLLLVLPADHVIGDVAAFSRAVDLAIPAAREGRLVTFGIVPTAPETGYGYIQAGQAGQADTANGDGEVKPVDRFVEKPDFETARKYVQSGGYFWNSGMFLFSPQAYLDELHAHAPEIAAACRRVVTTNVEHDGELDAEAFCACPSDSIDYAVMERTDRASVVPLDAGWSDVGSWAALQDIEDRDANGNTLLGDVIAEDCRGAYLRSESRLVAAVGVEDCVVVETRDAVLVAPRERAQDVKKIVDTLVANGRPETLAGREVFRPWGSYDSLESGEGFQVKRLTVLPGAILSLQSHRRRAEHWVVVAGVARITLDDRVFDLGVNEHTFIPVGAKHRIENPGAETLQIVEVQIGDYLGEDDIIRYEDKYGREGRTD